jgi:hypothetical protein
VDLPERVLVGVDLVEHEVVRVGDIAQYVEAEAARFVPA